MLATLYLSNGQENKKKEKTNKEWLFPNTLSHTSPQNHPHTYVYSKMLSKYSICVMPLHSKLYLFLLCNSKLMGK
jgi:hypothetical protein